MPSLTSPYLFKRWIIFFPGYPVDVAVLVFLIFIHWIAFYPVDSANDHNQTFMLVNKFIWQARLFHPCSK